MAAGIGILPPGRLAAMGGLGRRVGQCAARAAGRNVTRGPIALAALLLLLPASTSPPGPTEPRSCSWRRASCGRRRAPAAPLNRAALLLAGGVLLAERW